MKVFPFFLVALILSNAPLEELAAQPRGNEFLAPTRPEAWAMKYFNSVSLLTGYGPIAQREKGWIDFGLELVDIPSLSEEERRVGFDGAKVENLNNAPISIRPIISYYLTEKISFSGSYIPPIELWDVKANIFSFSLNWRAYEKGPFALGVRLYGQTGAATGAFTCTEDNVRAGNDFEGNPWGCAEVSRDRVHMDYYGGEGSISYRLEKLNGLTPYFSVGWNHMRNKFKLDSSLFGQPDKRLEKGESNTVSYSGGFVYPLNGKLSFGFQVFYTPLDVIRFPDTVSENDSLFNVRAQFIYHFGKLGRKEK